MSEKYLGESIKKLGFGLMRLAGLDRTGGSADREKTAEQMDAFIKAGFTYFDTAYVYGDGESEMAARDCLVSRYPRESFQLADKLPLFIVKSREHGQELFETSCKRCGVDYFDFYLLHAMDRGSAKMCEELDLWGLMKELKAAGKIRHMGFSFHDTADVLDDILTKHPEAEFVQLQINYMDWEDEGIQSRRCYETARKHGKPVIIMEPVKGGSLAGGMLPEAQEMLKKAEPEASIASWALRFAASLDGVITVLSGMNDIEQVRENTALMGDFKPLTGDERKLLSDTAALLRDTKAIPCTECRYCTDGCPQKINIPAVFKAYNEYMRFKNLDGAAFLYEMGTENGGKAKDCIACGACESHCPQKITIIENLKKAAELFGGKG